MRLFKRKVNSNKAVSEVLGTILLLGISVALFSIIYISLFSIQATPSTPSVNIVGTIKNNQLILDHMGGEDLKLDTKIIMHFPDDTRKSLLVKENDYLPAQAKIDNKWNIGEQFTYSLNGETSFNRFQPLDLTVVDQDSNSVIMNGIVKEAKKADLELVGDISSQDLTIGDSSSLSINLRNNGPSIAEDIKVNINIPDGLEYKNHGGDGNYDPATGIWDIDSIDSSVSSKNIDIELDVVGTSEIDFTQLVFIIDGSDNCSSTQFDKITTALKNAVLNTIPHPDPGKIELTVIQYGTIQGGASSNEPYHTAILEVGPVVLTSSNYNTVASEIDSITQMHGNCPMDAGILKAKDVVYASSNFDEQHKQLFCLFVSGLPDCYVHPDDESEYRATRPKDEDTAHELGKLAAGVRVGDLISDLQMTADQDEINCMLNLNPYGYTHEPSPWENPDNILWLKSDIAWPGSYYYEYGGQWPPEGPGWVRGVVDENNINLCIQEMLSTSTTSSKIIGEITETKYMDPVVDNNHFELIVQIS